MRVLPVWLGLSVCISATPAAAQTWRLVWHDEFAGAALDAAKWSRETGGGGWGNNELEYYTNRTVNSFPRGGKLVIQARRESFGGREYTSARLRTLNKGDWKYGRVEVRAKLPRGRGLWPAIWMMPSDSSYGGWAASGEIDILELLGHETSKVYGTIHYGGAAPANKSSGANILLPASENFADEFHVFALEWDAREFRWYVDGQLYSTKTDWYSNGGPFPAPFDKRFYLILNVAVGGNWPGSPDASTAFPQEMEVDYVRVFEDASTTPAPGGQIPGDGNQDGALDVADSVWMLLSLFGQHSVESFPCGGLSLSSGGNKTLLDVNGDAKIDLSDVVYSLTHLFLNGPPPVLGASCVVISGCPERCPGGCTASGKEPELLITGVPACGSQTDLRGSVCGLDPALHEIAAYVQVCGRWWGPKPSTAAPLTPIGPDGSWTVDVTTGGQDPRAGRYAVYVIPAGFVPPVAAGALRLPGVLEGSAVLATQSRRACACP